MPRYSSLLIFRTYLRSPHNSICWSCLRQRRAQRPTLQPTTISITSASTKSSTSSTNTDTSSPPTRSTSSNSLAFKDSTPIPSPKTAGKATADPTKSSKSARLSILDKPGDNFVPPILQHALGLPERPQPGQNSGFDTRTWRQRRDDFHNYEKHLQRRKQLKDRLYRPYFRDWTNMKHHQGKSFFANSKLLRPDSALFFPNLCGITLASGGKVTDTTPLLTGRVSVVTIFSSAWAENQTKSFTDAHHNPKLRTALAQNDKIGLAQQVDINVEENALKAGLIRLFAYRLRKLREEKDWGRYFLVRRGLTDEMREAMGILNKKVGYVYLVDGACRIRWAGSGVAEGEESLYLVDGFKRLVEQLRIKSTSKINESTSTNGAMGGRKSEMIK